MQIGGRIAVVNADGSDWRLVTDGSGFDSEPAWSADGREVAFTRSRGDLGEDVFAVSADGTRLRQITRGAQVSDVAWSSRNQLAYVSSVGKVRVIKADRRGRHRRVLATVPDARFLDWSPDGNRLLFTRSGPRADGASTWSVDRRGTRARLEARRVTNAFWSPTGRRIASEGNFTFILSRLDGSRRRPIRLQLPPGWGFAKPQAWQSVRR